MAITFGATSGVASAATSSSTPMTFTVTDPLSADVWLAHNYNANVAPSAVTYNGAAPDAGTSTAIATVAHGNNAASFGSVRIYYWHAAGTGGSVTVAATPGSNSARCQMRSVSYSGVASQGSPVTNFSTGTAGAAGAVTLTAGQLALGFLTTAASVAVGPMSSPTGSGSTNRVLVNDAANAGGICIGDSATSGVVFGCTSSSASAPWGNVTIILTEASGGGPSNVGGFAGFFE